MFAASETTQRVAGSTVLRGTGLSQRSRHRHLYQRHDRSGSYLGVVRLSGTEKCHKENLLIYQSINSAISMRQK
jgi:hypothetical protein